MELNQTIEMTDSRVSNQLNTRNCSTPNNEPQLQLQDSNNNKIPSVNIDMPLTQSRPDFSKNVNNISNSLLMRSLDGAVVPSTQQTADSVPNSNEPTTHEVNISNYDGSMQTTTAQSVSPGITSSNDAAVQECIICFKWVPTADYMNHLEACLSVVPDRPSPPPPLTTTFFADRQGACFNCSCTVDITEGLGFVIQCQSKHTYCFRCLHTALSQYLTMKLSPLCPSTACDYQLSRHDLACIPLTQRMFRQLTALVKTQRRPQCPRCYFYVDLQGDADLDQHMESCHPEDMIPCEHCFCPQELTVYEEHSQQCEENRTERQQNLIEFILPRTKYPFTAKQIDFFIEHKKKSLSTINPQSIVEELAQYDDVFPLELPTHECEVCNESLLLDDIFVFGCDESHKICYKCYEAGCRVKMNNNEMLTCAICLYQLQYGELKQLRVSPEDIDKFVNYQIQKTFDRYAGVTRGIIKCPNQQCTWAFEPNDPSERFRVVCQLCGNEFCSLCNQQYHYRTPCEQLTTITEQWFFWCNSERGRYLARRAKQDAAYAARLADYNKQHAANEKRNESLRHRYDTAVKDETYKAENCRHCPHCNRVVERIEGCASMICGTDYHGGNNQSGCGKAFSWDSAKPYRAATVRQSQELAMNLPRPEHPVLEHENIKCDGCHETVRGIRFDCVHCPSLIFCEKCEQQRTLAHSEENQHLGQQQHIFRLKMTPFDEAVY